MDTLASGISTAKQMIQRTSPRDADIMSAFSGSSSADNRMSYSVNIDLHETNVNGRMTYWVSRQSPVYLSILRQLRHLTCLPTINIQPTTSYLKLIRICCRILSWNLRLNNTLNAISPYQVPCSRWPVYYVQIPLTRFRAVQRDPFNYPNTAENDDSCPNNRKLLSRLRRLMQIREGTASDHKAEVFAHNFVNKVDRIQASTSPVIIRAIKCIQSCDVWRNRSHLDKISSQTLFTGPSSDVSDKDSRPSSSSSSSSSSVYSGRRMQLSSLPMVYSGSEFFSEVVLDRLILAECIKSVFKNSHTGCCYYFLW